jgi:UPF0176 protein
MYLSMLQKTILYYKFVPITDPTSVMFWQRALCEKLELKGRILISPHGINGTLGGELKNLRLYKRTMTEHPLFKGITYKWSDGGAGDFPKLVVKVRPEIVTFGAPDEIKVDMNGVIGGGKHLKPEQVHQLVKEKGDEVIFYDGRNMYEAKIGKFKNAVIPKVRRAVDFIDDIENGDISKHKDKPIVTYCTGGVRCEILTTLMKNRGYKDVYQMDGGIVKYGQKFGDDGLWEGKLFVFDQRMQMAFSDNAQDIGDCSSCGAKTSRLINSENVRRQLSLQCENCALQPQPS